MLHSRPYHVVPQRLVQPRPCRRGLDPVDGGPVVAPLHLRAGAGRQEAQGAAVPHTLHPGGIHHVRAQLQLRLQVTQTEVPNTLLCLDIFEEFHPMSMGRVGARTGFMQSSWSTRTCCRREGGTPVRSSHVHSNRCLQRGVPGLRAGLPHQQRGRLPGALLRGVNPGRSLPWRVGHQTASASCKEVN